MSFCDFSLGDVVAILWEGSGGDGVLLAVLKIQGNLLETWGGEHVAVCGWADGIEAHRGKYIPCRHLACIIVAREAAWGVVVLCVEDVGYALDSLFALVDVAVEPRYLMTWFVAVPIPTLIKHRVEFGFELIFSTKEIN